MLDAPVATRPSMLFSFARSRVALIFTQRCFYLLIALLALIAVAPVVLDTERGRILINCINLFILIAAVAAVGRTTVSFVFITGVACLAFGSQLLSLEQPTSTNLALSMAFGATAYFVTICYLLVYVFSKAVITQDKLYGAAAGYLMIGVLWSYFYALVQYLVPGSFVAGAQAQFGAAEFIYYSFTVLTSGGFGTVTPVLPLARSVTMLEQVTGVLFVAILIARLASTYGPGKATGER
jgi:hypothetical protein